MGSSSSLKRTMVISGVNFFEGGPLSLMTDVLIEASKLKERYNLRVIALVSKKELFANVNLGDVELIEFPESRKSYFQRLRLEYLAFRSFAERNKVDLWFSLHDITPRLSKATQQVVYFHNPAPFYNISKEEFRLDRGFGLFAMLYKYLYRTNIFRNNYVIVQQSWLRDRVNGMFRFPKNRIVVAHPSLNTKPSATSVRKADGRISLLFPTFPRVFKNIEVLGNAARILKDRGILDFEILVTVTGNENKYSAHMKNMFHDVPQLKFIGRQTRQEVFGLFSSVDALVFPSKLETWGLPISEFKETGKPILLADLQYAHETLGDYPDAFFFDPYSPETLANGIARMIKGENIFFQAKRKTIEQPYANNWQELFDIVLAKQ